ncbi:hypothetical protein [uncultured Winogradskyella sp.]|uniref:hypothetical protein n=1 Tax=uncultured Winogradskyella sp. TaxID=395353 RepID=UPI00261BFDF8|nr:hypothetical protein [uncultured Winogradskyella sp.]
MKNTIKLVSTLSFFLLFTLGVFAQSQSTHQCNSTTSNRNIELEGSSDTENIKIEVDKDVNKIHIGVSSTIKSGYLTVEVYDPKGNKKGNFSVESQIKPGDKKKELVCGQMQKQIDEPIEGTWIVKLIPRDAVGTISIHTSQI